MQTFVISDTHFGHANMTKYHDRPERFDRVLIENWNRVVGKQDLIIHLGDVAVSRSDGQPQHRTTPGPCLHRPLTVRHEVVTKSGWVVTTPAASICQASRKQHWLPRQPPRPLPVTVPQTRPAGRALRGVIQP